MILKYSLLKFLKVGAVPLLMTAVALRQIVLVHTAGLSPWHGGGYGMFASIDRDERRVITAQRTGCGTDADSLASVQTLTADSPEVLRPDAYTHISTFPTESQLRRAGQRLLAAAPDQSCDSVLQLQPWRLVYDGDAMAYEPLTPPVEVQP